jgi:polyphosphate kinase 2 (PPK2 family)
MEDSATILKPAAETQVSAPAAPAPGPKTFPAATPLHQAFESGRYPYARLMGRVTYEAQKAKLQAELLKVQIWAQETGQKFVILLEGRDAAGKGGTIKRFMEHLNPRYARVCALEASPRMWRWGSGSSNATSRICRPPGKWCSTTAPGTTGRVSNG